MIKTEKFWNFVYSICFIIAILLISLFSDNILQLIDDLKLLDLAVISLAAYRLTRLLVYDKVLNFLRDFIIKSKSEAGFVKSTQYFLTCPWCAGIWMTLLIVIVYLYFPAGKLFSYILAISGVASFIHITISLLGWLSEERKINLKKLRKDNSEDVRS
ncbi:MAG: hypothetical protein A2033_13015 [Bacteroidetes bacterium GWA2_31_9]|nr:MAG: hypothetical protein A2033_13015 [Bacteroidetes bacterium GWA2_31_9]